MGYTLDGLLVYHRANTKTYKSKSNNQVKTHRVHLDSLWNPTCTTCFLLWKLESSEKSHIRLGRTSWSPQRKELMEIWGEHYQALNLHFCSVYLEHFSLYRYAPFTYHGWVQKISDEASVPSVALGRKAAVTRGTGSQWNQPNLASAAPQAARNQSAPPCLFKTPWTLQSVSSSAAFPATLWKQRETVILRDARGVTMKSVFMDVPFKLLSRSKSHSTTWNHENIPISTCKSPSH